jgi:curved DNA-binding protein
MGEMRIEEARRLLSVVIGASGEELRLAYRNALKIAHPDRGGTDEQLRDIVEAYRILTEAPTVSTRRRNARYDPPPAKLDINPVTAVVGGRTVTRLPDGRRVAITLPPGLRQGDRISLMDVVLTIHIKGRQEMFVSGDDLCMLVKTTAQVLKEGGRLQIKTPTGPRTVWIPKQPGHSGIVKIPGQGLPPNGRHQQGALILKLVPEKGPKDGRVRSKFWDRAEA